jgi:GNAT superfamily N-acetyltransferase
VAVGAVDDHVSVTGDHDAVRVRRAHADDADAITDVWLRARRASIPAIPAPIHRDDEVRRWFADTVLPERTVWILTVGTRVVALLVLDDGWVDQLYVDSAHTGAGFGSRLLDIAKREYPGGLDLWTFASNSGARRFYERHGFVAVDATNGDNEEGAPDVRFHWPGG